MTGSLHGGSWSCSIARQLGRGTRSGNRRCSAHRCRAGNNRIEELSSTGEFIRAFGTSGSGELDDPQGVKIDSSGNVWVADTDHNRIVEFSSTGTYIAAYGSKGSGNGQFYDPTDIAFSGSNLYVTDSGNHRVQELSNTGTYISQFGTEGSGSGEFYTPEGMAADSAGNLYVVDGPSGRVQEFTAAGTFIASFATKGTGEGQLNEPSGISISAAGVMYVDDTGENRVEAWVPADQAAHDTKTIYYTAKTEAEVAACQNHPEWTGLPCMNEPAAQPETKELPSLPVTTTTYNMWNEPEMVTETFPATEKFSATTRTKKIIYDEAGRMLSTEETSSSSDQALPKVSDEYSAETGQVIKQSTTVEGKTKTITSVFNKLGQLTEYTDADGNKTTYVYDEDGRVTEMVSAKGTEQESHQTYAYDPTTGYLTKLLDSGARTFTANYDVEGNIISEGYPNGMTATYTRNAAGEATHLVYEKVTDCSSGCKLFEESLSLSIHGEVFSEASTLADESYSYDSIGRLLEVKETPTSEPCTARIYTYNEESNRSSLTKRGCSSEGGEIETHKYDPANRLIDPGVGYEALGNTTSLSAADAGGSELETTYYVDGQVATQSQSGETIDYYLDPDDRVREEVSSGKTAATVIDHYAGPGESPIWVNEGSKKWTRDIPGIDGALVATESNGSTPLLQLHDLQGNVIGSAGLSEVETTLLMPYNSSEFGVPTTSKPPKYSWLGASGLSSELSSGTLVTGTTAYVPQIARSLQSENVVSPAEVFPNGTYTGQPYTTGISGEAITLGNDFATNTPGRQASRENEARIQSEEEALFHAPHYPDVAETTPMPTEGGAEEPLGGYEGWACEYAEQTGQEEGCAGGSVGSDPVASTASAGEWVCVIAGSIVAAGVGALTAEITGVLAEGAFTAGCIAGSSKNGALISGGPSLSSYGVGCYYVFTISKRTHKRDHRSVECESYYT